MGNYFKVCKKVSISDICEDIIIISKGTNKTTAYRNKIKSLVHNAIERDSWCSEDIYIELNLLDYLTLEEIKRALAKKPPNINLLSKKERVHNELLLSSTCPVIDFDEADDLLDIFSDDTRYEYYLEEIASYSKEDLYLYLKKKNVLGINSPKKVKGVLEYLLEETGDVNIVMYMIDFASKHYKNMDKKIFNPICINDFYEVALKEFTSKKNSIKCKSIELKERVRDDYEI